MHSKPYTKREIRARVRETRLRELGYDDYSAYLRSSAWRDLKERYRASDLPQLCMCGDTQVQLHHTTYDRVGREALEDLIPLCQDCHAHAHALEAAGVIELDLWGFYYDPERARDGQMYLAQLTTVCPSGEVLRADKRRGFEERRAQRLGTGVSGLSARTLRHINDAAERRTRRAGNARRQDGSARPEDLQHRTFNP